MTLTPQEQLARFVASAEAMISEAVEFAKANGLEFDLKVADKLGTGIGYIDNHEGYYSFDSLKDFAEDDAHERMEDLGDEYQAYIRVPNPDTTDRWRTHIYEDNPNKADDYDEKLAEVTEEVLAGLIADFKQETSGGVIRYSAQHGLTLTQPWVASSINC